MFISSPSGFDLEVFGTLQLCAGLSARFLENFVKDYDEGALPSLRSGPITAVKSPKIRMLLFLFYFTVAIFLKDKAGNVLYLLLLSTNPMMTLKPTRYFDSQYLPASRLFCQRLYI